MSPTNRSLSSTLRPSAPPLLLRSSACRGASASIPEELTLEQATELFNAHAVDGKISTKELRQPQQGGEVFRTFLPSTAKGGITVDPATTAVLCIEYQNEFATEGGKLHGAVGPVMKTTNMLENTIGVCTAARATGAKVFHEGISFAEDASDNPNKGLGILAGCAGDKLFTAGTWNAEFCEAMKPQDGDVVVQGKKGLDGFPGTDLEEQLVAHGIETIALCGFLTNCCVESTMRTAYEKGFNVSERMMTDSS